MGGLYINDNGTPKDIVNENPIFPYITDLIGSTDISDIGDGTVTGAISRVNSDLSELIKTDVITLGEYTVNAKNQLTIDVAIPNIDGYTPIGILGVNLNHVYMFLSTFVINQDGSGGYKLYAIGLNGSNVPLTVHPIAIVLYLKNS